MVGTGVREGALLYQGVDRSNVAFKLMKQMGWEDGEGLGVNKQGIKSHVRAVKKLDVTAGVGLVEARKAAADWTCHTLVYDKLLKSLKSTYETTVLSADAKGDTDSDHSESDESDTGEQKLVADGHKKSEKIVVEEAKKVARPQGRYKKREAAKAVKSYSCTDLAAILGGGDNLPKKEKSKCVVQKEDSAVVKSEAEPSSPGTPGRDLELRKISHNPKPLKIKCVINATTKPLGEVAVPPPASDWWGSKMGFVAAGTLAGISDEEDQRTRNSAGRNTSNGPSESKANSKQQIHISMFQEEDQERLCKTVQENATTGRMGLGRSSMPKKVAGARWAGKKVQFGSDDEEEDEDGSDSDGCLQNTSSGQNLTESGAGSKDVDSSIVKEAEVDGCAAADAKCRRKEKKMLGTGKQDEKSRGEHMEMDERKEKAGKKKKKKREKEETPEASTSIATTGPSSHCERTGTEDSREETYERNQSPQTAMDNSYRREGAANSRRIKGVLSDKETCESLGDDDEDAMAGRSGNKRAKKRRKKAAKDETAVEDSARVATDDGNGAVIDMFVSKERDNNVSSLDVVECHTIRRKGIEKEEGVGGTNGKGTTDGDDECNAWSRKADGNADKQSVFVDKNMDKVLKRVKWKRLTSEVLQKALSEGVKLRALERMVRRAARAVDPRVDDTKLRSFYRQKVEESSRFAILGKRVFIAECEPVS